MRLGGSPWRDRGVAENLDAGRFSDAGQYVVFKDFLERKYAGKNLDLVMVFMARDYGLVGELTATVISNLPVVFVAVNELDLAKCTIAAEW